MIFLINLFGPIQFCNGNHFVIISIVTSFFLSMYLNENRDQREEEDNGG